MIIAQWKGVNPLHQEGRTGLHQSCKGTRPCKRAVYFCVLLLLQFPPTPPEQAELSPIH